MISSSAATLIFALPLITVTGERPYTCPGCPKRFARRSALRIHKISVHEDIKSFLCPECGSAFKANSALIDHRKRVHLQIKPHQCEFCKKDFFSKKDYSEHLRTHTGEKPFQCQLCGRCFGRQNHLKRHVEGVHKNGASNSMIYYANVKPELEKKADEVETAYQPIITDEEAASMGLVNIANIVTSSETQEIIVESIDFDALQMQQHFLITTPATSSSSSNNASTNNSNQQQLCKLR